MAAKGFFTEAFFAPGCIPSGPGKPTVMRMGDSFPQVVKLHFLSLNTWGGNPYDQEEKPGYRYAQRGFTPRRVGFTSMCPYGRYSEIPF
jgi:hypothetical protein